MGKNILLWVVIVLVLLTVFNNINTQPTAETMDYSTFITEVKNDRVKRVVIDGVVIKGERHNNSAFETVRPYVEDPRLLDDLYNHGVEVEGRKPEQQSLWTQLLVACFPILIIIAVFMFFMRQMQGGGGGRGGPMAFGKSKARLLGEDQIKTTFADVAGVDEAIEGLEVAEQADTEALAALVVLGDERPVEGLGERHQRFAASASIRTTGPSPTRWTKSATFSRRSMREASGRTLLAIWADCCLARRVPEVESMQICGRPKS